MHTILAARALTTIGTITQPGYFSRLGPLMKFQLFSLDKTPFLISASARFREYQYNSFATRAKTDAATCNALNIHSSVELVLEEFRLFHTVFYL